MNLLENNTKPKLKMIIKLIQKELINILKEKKRKKSNKKYSTKKILLLGLQGIGKTNTTVKLALFLQKKYKKKIILTSVDIFLPMAQEQLKILTYKTKLITTPIINNETSVSVTEKSLKYFKYLMLNII